MLGEYSGLDVRSAHVVDLGAHKGYFAVWAFRHGAEHVSSYEPHPANFAALAEISAGDGRWPVFREAVGGSTRTSWLREAESWSHSLADDGGLEVPVTAIGEAIGRALEAHPRRLVVKMDVEGAEHEICCGRSVQALCGVDALAVEIHDRSSDSRCDISQRLAGVGLRESSRRREIRFYARIELRQPNANPRLQRGSLMTEPTGCDSLRIAFSDFWTGFDPCENFLWESIRSRWRLELDDDAELLLYGPVVVEATEVARPRCWCSASRSRCRLTSVRLRTELASARGPVSPSRPARYLESAAASRLGCCT